MPVVRVEPAGVAIDVADGETLMHAAERLGYRWPTVCHGQAKCTACFVVVEEGGDELDPAGPIELAGLELFQGGSPYEGREVRLACQLRPLGDAVVRKRGVRPMHDGDGS
ncbi:MAG: 2Fe-2S iron-sulfur cluster-binding protein [Mycobacterium sp.]